MNLSLQTCTSDTGIEAEDARFAGNDANKMKGMLGMRECQME